MNRFLRSLLFIFILSAPIIAQISPGKLSQYHQDLEGIANCTRCHDLGREVSNDKCLECHLSVKNRIVDGKGYHSSDEVKSKHCARCHSDHHGRDFELLYWKDGRENFDHDLTGYKLEAKHKLTDCTKCHKEAFVSREYVKIDKNCNLERTMLGLNGSECISCHNDEHGTQLDNQCLKCHSYEGWKPSVGFDHDSTRYPLTGKHIDLACVKCHKIKPITDSLPVELIAKADSVGWFSEYSDLEFKSCKSCHEDTHKGKLGDDCQKCHQTSGFKNVLGGQGEFDHSKTNYRLEGKHINVDCKKCHVSGNLTAKLKYEHCSDCHKDEHRRQFADRSDQGACESCHTVESFLPANYEVEHHQKSRYPLTGGHLATPCILCHVGIVTETENYTRFDFADRSCASCHKDIHEGQADKWVKSVGCNYCHTTDSWHMVESFNHDSSRFKLMDKHKKVACIYCHQINDELASVKKIVLQPIDMNCVNCHKDIHYGQFVRDESGENATMCDRCHSAKGWKELTFNHNLDSRYKLDGAHDKVKCAKCHLPLAGTDGKIYIKYRPKGMECADCHSGTVPVKR